MGMYNNAYISMSRNHNDSDLRRCCADIRYQKTGNIHKVEKQEHQHGVFDEKNTKKVRKMLEGCLDDVQFE